MSCVVPSPLQLELQSCCVFLPNDSIPSPSTIIFGDIPGTVRSWYHNQASMPGTLVVCLPQISVLSAGHKYMEPLQELPFVVSKPILEEGWFHPVTNEMSTCMRSNETHTGLMSERHIWKFKWENKFIHSSKYKGDRWVCKMYLHFITMNLFLFIIEINGFIIVMGYIMGIHHHYSLFNTEQTFDRLLLIYRDKRQTNLSRATLRDRSLHMWSAHLAKLT